MMTTTTKRATNNQRPGLLEVVAASFVSIAVLWITLYIANDLSRVFYSRPALNTDDLFVLLLVAVAITAVNVRLWVKYMTSRLSQANQKFENHSRRAIELIGAALNDPEYDPTEALNEARALLADARPLHEDERTITVKELRDMKKENEELRARAASTTELEKLKRQRDEAMHLIENSIEHLAASRGKKGFAATALSLRRNMTHFVFANSTTDESWIARLTREFQSPVRDVIDRWGYRIRGNRYYPDYPTDSVPDDQY